MKLEEIELYLTWLRHEVDFCIGPPISLFLNRGERGETKEFRDSLNPVTCETLNRQDKLLLRKCLSTPNRASPSRWIVIDVGLFTIYHRQSTKDVRYTAHTNILLIDKEKQEIQRFEPFMAKKRKVEIAVDECIRRLLGLEEYLHLSTSTFCPLLPQRREISHTRRTNCSYWCLFYIETRLRNPEIENQEILEWLTQETPEILATYISDYIRHVDSISGISE